MTEKTTDLQPRGPEGAADDFKIGAGWVLATIAHRYRGESPEAAVEPLGFVVAVGAAGYKLMGGSYRGGLPLVARIAHDVAPDVREGVTRGEFAGLLSVAARSLGFEWGDDVDEPAIPRIPIPGPRRATALASA
ncbi:hypothetical protein [Streptomyces sp. NPDC047070]|uniref:hypothetical protein n=1 Tax=Streptomyces sp. NPDC047070 TaxID=3154923 RepID=UPI003456061B